MEEFVNAIPQELLDGRVWEGLKNKILVHIIPLTDSPHWHISIANKNTQEHMTTRRAVTPEALAYYLQKEGLDPKSIHWVPTTGFSPIKRGDPNPADSGLPKSNATPLPPPNERAVVYIVRVVGTNLVKIGWAVNARERRKNLQIGCPFDLVLEAVIPTVSAQSAEGELHRRFKDYHFRGEWFKREGKLKDFIEKLQEANPPCPAG